MRGTHANSAEAISRKFGLDLGEAEAIVPVKKGVFLSFSLMIWILEELR